MKVAVSGATGFIGRPLVQRLLQSGHEVLALTRSPDGAARVLPERARAERFAPEGAWDPGVLRGVDAVVNLAGEPVAQRWTAAHKERILQSRVAATAALAAAARESGTVRRFVSASAVGYYGNTREAPVDEDSPPGRDFLARVCVAWEAEAAKARAAGLSTAVVRFGVVLHPEGGALKALLKQFRLGTGGVVGSGDQYVSWIHREDAVGLLAFALEHPEVQGPLNATAPEPLTNREFAHALGHALRRPSLVHVPGFVLKAVLGEMASAVLEGQRVLPRRTREAGFRWAHPALPEALVSLLSAAPEAPPAPRPSGASRP